MTNHITVGKRLIPRNDIVLVEPYEPRDDNRMQSSRDFQTRIMLVTRDSVLIEQKLELLAEELGLRMIEADRVAINPGIRFSVEMFSPADDFTPTKPYVTRLKWNCDGTEHSKLLVTEPEDVLNIVTGETEVATEASRLPPPRSANSSRPPRARRPARVKSEPQQA